MQDEVLYFDPAEWTVGDLYDFEEFTGSTLDEAFQPASAHDSRGEVIKDGKGRPVKSIKLNAKVMIAIAWIEGRKVDEGFTLEDARKTKASALQLRGGDADPEGTAGDAGATKS